MMNKKGITYLSAPLVFAVILAIIFLIFLFGGGAKTIWNISSFISKIPTWFWVILAILFIFKAFGGKKR